MSVSEDVEEGGASASNRGGNRGRGRRGGARRARGARGRGVAPLYKTCAGCGAHLRSSYIKTHQKKHCHGQPAANEDDPEGEDENGPEARLGTEEETGEEELLEEMENFDNLDFNLEEIIGEVQELEETIRGQRRLTGLHLPNDEEDGLQQSSNREKRRRGASSPSSPSSPLHQRVRRTSGDPPPGVEVDEFGLPLPSPQSPSLPPRAPPSWASNPRQVLTGSGSSSPTVHTSQDDIYHIQLGPQLQNRPSGDVPSLAATGKVVIVLHCTEINSMADMQNVMSVPSACVNFLGFFVCA